LIIKSVDDGAFQPSPISSTSNVTLHPCGGLDSRVFLTHLPTSCPLAVGGNLMLNFADVKGLSTLPAFLTLGIPSIPVTVN